MLSPALFILFFCSGISGLIYQVIWVRQFGQIFGNTTYSASLVVAIFMLGLGSGSYLLGAWADRSHTTGARRLLAVYAALELAIAMLGFLISLTLPRLAAFVADFSSYADDGAGWQALSISSYVVRASIALILLVPITVLMGGTLTVLIRYATRADARSGWVIALLYSANTIGAAAGAFATDFALIPTLGLLRTQVAAVVLNLLAGAGAWILSRRVSTSAAGIDTGAADHRADRSKAQVGQHSDGAGLVWWTAGALALSGFAALGVEILWLRHLGILLGGFRAVFSLLLTVMLVALGIGALLGGWLARRFGSPARVLMVVQGVFAATTLLGLASADAVALGARAVTFAGDLRALSVSGIELVELWFNLRPMLLEVAVPALVGGCAFPLANAIVQRSATAVGTRAGVLYAANTAGAVLGSLTTGYLLLPRFGMQGTAAVLAAAAVLAIVPLYLSRREDGEQLRGRLVLGGAVLVPGVALLLWLMLPADFLLARAIGPRDTNERLLTVSEGPDELLAIVEAAGRGRGLLTNGHAMSSTARLDQRYMRALAHVPLLLMPQPQRVLVIGFGVGNTTHAATLHASVTRVDVADLSRNILGHAGYFADTNRNVLMSPKVSVFVNDGRMHLQMAAQNTYDLIALEPPPIAHAGVASLYSREFYELAKSRLKSGGYVSQWLPAYQVPAESSLAMVRAFVEVFPQAVLLSGAQAELILLGTTGPRIELDPDHLAYVLTQQPMVRADLAAVELGSPREIAAMFVGSADTMTRAALEAPALSDDRPIQEYGVLSTLTNGLMGVPAGLFELTAAPGWCPRCYVGGEIAPSVAGLDLHFALLQQAYTAPVAEVAEAVGASFGARRILGSAYLGSVVPDSAEVHNILGIAALRDGLGADAIVEFEAALARDPNSMNARVNLGQIRFEQGVELLEAKRFADAVPLLRVAVTLAPDHAEAQNDLGVALASLGSVTEAIEHFTRAVTIAPAFTEAQANLAAARDALRQ